MKRAYPLFLSSGFLLLLALGGPHVARAQIAVVSELADERVVASGAGYEGTIEIRNETDEPQEVKVYQTDYLFYADGTNLYGEPGSHARSNAGWITFSPNYLTLPPRQTLPVRFNVAVPPADSLSGTYWSMLMVEAIPKGSPESALADSASEQQQLGLRTTIRYGIQIITTIGGTGQQLVGLSNTKLTTSDTGEKVLQIDIENEGELAMRPQVWVELYDEQGTAQGRFDGNSYRIYPGTSVRQRINLGTVEDGRYKALVFVDAGGEDVFGAQYSLEL